MEFNGLLQTRRDAMLLLEFRMKDTRKVVQCCESIRMARGTEYKGSSNELNDLIQRSGAL
jgi:hypothetical protein